MVITISFILLNEHTVQLLLLKHVIEWGYVYCQQVSTVEGVIIYLFD